MKLLKHISIDRFFSVILQLLKQFSFSIVIACSIAIFLILLNHDIITDQLQLEKIVFTLTLCFFLSTGFYLFARNQKYSFLLSQIFQIPVLIFGFLYYNYSGFDYNNFTISLSLLFAFISFIFVAPFLGVLHKRELNLNKNYIPVLEHSLGAFLTAFFIGISTLVLGLLALGAISELFSLQLYSFITDWGILSVTLLAPLIGLYYLTNKGISTKQSTTLSTTNSFFLQYILIPFVCIYFIILYIYSANLLLGIHGGPYVSLSWMVIGFSILGYLAYIFSYRLSELSYISLFRNLLPFIILPQIGVLFYAIFLRISQYGVTENRYFVVLFGVWLSIITLYFIFSKYKKIIIIPASFSLLAILSTIGPLSSYSVSLDSQMKKFKDITMQEKIVVNGEINTENTISLEKASQLNSIIHYLCKLDNCESLISYLQLEDELDAQIGDDTNYHNSYWQKKEFIEKKLNTNGLYFDTLQEDDGKESFSFNFGLLESEALYIADYNYFTTINSYKKSIVSEDDKMTHINIAEKYILIPDENGEIVRIDITKQLDELILKVKELQKLSNEELGEEKVSFIVSNEHFFIKLYINYLHLTIKDGKIDTSENAYNEIEGYILYNITD